MSTEYTRGELTEAAPADLRPFMDEVVELSRFRAEHAGTVLGLAERRLIVEQALVLVEQNYVHLPHKVAMHGVNPVQQLRLLRARLAAQAQAGSGEPDDGLEGADAQDFHAELCEIFHSLHDLHTNYLLPPPFAGQVAFLPFLVEEFHEDDATTGPRPRYLVTKVLAGAPLVSGFGAGALVTSWNGVPIERAVDLAASRFAGSNPAARHARGVESLTVRPLRLHRTPDEDWVHIGFETPSGTAGELRQPWLVAPNLPPAVGDPAHPALGLDLGQDETGRARTLLFAPDVAASQVGAGDVPSSPDEIPTDLPGLLRARRVEIGGVTYGHLRIFSFNTPDPAVFVAEVVRLLEALPPEGLVLDVRGNGGGHIWAAEMLLQTLTPRTITPEPAQFITTGLNTELCHLHAEGQAGIALGSWLPSMRLAVRTGAPYSSAYPITPPEMANSIGQRYFGPVVLVTDARCYSATDILAAGFADHRIGPILGVDANTGAGGANVWSHTLLRQLFTPDDGTPSAYRPLPAGVDMRVSIRRTLRVGDSAGTPVEDLGVRPDVRHLLTRRDVTGANEDLMAAAAKLLAERGVHRLEVVPSGSGDEVDATAGTAGTGTAGDAAAGRVVHVRVTGVDRVDAYLDDRPLGSWDVQSDRDVRSDKDMRSGGDGAADRQGAVLDVRLPPVATGRLQLLGFAAGELVAARLTDPVGPPEPADPVRRGRQGEPATVDLRVPEGRPAPGR